MRCVSIISDAMFHMTDKLSYYQSFWLVLLAVIFFLYMLSALWLNV